MPRALPRRAHRSDEIQLSFRITIYNLLAREEPCADSCIREYGASVLSVASTPVRSYRGTRERDGERRRKRGKRREGRKGTRGFWALAISPAGRSALIRPPLARAQTRTRVSLGPQSSSVISVIPSDDFSPFVPRAGPSMRRLPPRLGSDSCFRISIPRLSHLLPLRGSSFRLCDSRLKNRG